MDAIEEVVTSGQLEIPQIQLNYINHDQSAIFGPSMVLQPMQGMIFYHLLNCLIEQRDANLMLLLHPKRHRIII